MKEIDTLVEDIYELLEGSPADYLEEHFDELGSFISQSVSRQLTRGREGNQRVYFSNIGRPCDRQLWYKCNQNELAEKLPAAAKIKFMYGDILEELLLFLAVQSGHRVEAMQERVAIGEMSGRIDAIIDGVVVDVKSASPFAFQKFKRGLTDDEDSFGYLDQLHGYAYALRDDPRVTDRSRVAFFVVDKSLGHLHLDIHTAVDDDYERLVNDKVAISKQPSVPERYYNDIPDGKSGNRKLCTQCSYCDFKHTCWPDVRTFIYSNGPRFLTQVEREPDVKEVTDGS